MTAQDPDADELLEVLCATTGQGRLDPRVNESLIDAALGLESAPTGAEAADAERLRQALEGAASHPLVELVTALQAVAHAEASALDAFTERRLIYLALDKTHASRSRRRSQALVATGAAVAFAAAAGVIIAMQPPLNAPSPSAGVLRLERTTQTELHAPLAVEGTSHRLDRLAELRMQDFRNNRFTRWGIE